VLAAGVGVAVVGTGTAVALAATSSTGPNLRVATVRVGSVDQTVETSGTISSSLKLTPSFASSGTVASVNVSVGQRVRKGQVLAKLDTTSLQADVDSANSTLASAKQQLQADETGQTGSSNNGTNNASNNGASNNGASNNGASDIVTAAYVTYLTVPSTSISELIKQVEDAQQALITATTNSAALLGLDALGALAVGKEGTLIALEGNPLTDITAVLRVRAVVKAGQVVKRPASGVR